LAGIVTTAEIIASDQDAPERDRQYASIISASGRQLASFFTSCLDLSKLGMQEWVSKTEIFSLRQLVNDIKILFAQQALSKGLMLIVEYDDTLPACVEGHRGSLYRVLLNLIGNALKFTEQGSITLRALRADLVDDHQVKVVFQVQDTGIGIPEDKHQVIFEKLRRLTPSYESKIEGSGIGLYIVEQFIKRMGGDIAVKSTVGEGSTFIITLPLKISSHKTIESSDMVQSIESTLPITNTIQIPNNIAMAVTQERVNTEHLPRILLVEDTDIIQLVTKSLLSDTGFSVDIASTGEEAVEMFLPGKYGLIYMDIGLPKMNGYETVQAIRNKESSLKADKCIPIIALTGHGAVDVQEFCGQVGMQGILSKPLSREQAEKVWRCYGQHEPVAVPGLTVLENNATAANETDILDFAATVKRIGSKALADTMIANFVTGLEGQFLPKLKAFIEQNAREEVRFHLHQQIGSVAYVEAPRLRETLLSIQKAVHQGTELTPDIYKDIENAVSQVIQCYRRKSHTSLFF